MVTLSLACVAFVERDCLAGSIRHAHIWYVMMCAHGEWPPWQGLLMMTSLAGSLLATCSSLWFI